MKRPAFYSVVVAVMVFSGCAGSGQTTPPSPASEGTAKAAAISLGGWDEVLVSVIVSYVSDCGWEIVRVAPGEGTVEALAAVQDFGDQAIMRNRWLFNTNGGNITLARALEVKFDRMDSDWVSSNPSDDGYDPSLERDHLSAIRSRVEQAMQIAQGVSH